LPIGPPRRGWWWNGRCTWPGTSAPPFFILPTRGASDRGAGGSPALP
jgi:hypothetical protein